MRKLLMVFCFMELIAWSAYSEYDNGDLTYTRNMPQISTLKLSSRTGIAGTVTLSNGSATVLNPEINSDCIIFLSRKSGGLNIGYLTYSISDGIGFTVSSLNVLDNSRIGYLIIEIQ